MLVILQVGSGRSAAAEAHKADKHQGPINSRLDENQALNVKNTRPRSTSRFACHVDPCSDAWPTSALALQRHGQMLATAALLLQLCCVMPFVMCCIQRRRLLALEL